MAGTPQPPAPKPISLVREVVVDAGAMVKMPEGDDFPELQAFRGAPVGWSKDLDRVLALPRRLLDAEKDTAARDKWTRLLRNGTPVGGCACAATWGFCIHEYMPVQGWAFEETQQVGGLIGTIGAGAGKTGVDIFITYALGVERAMLLVPANLKAQLLNRDIPQWAAHFKVPNLGGGHGKSFVAGRPVLWVVTYSELQTAKNTDLIQRINPQAIIADEVHMLKDMGSARTKRVADWFRKNPATKFVGLSGTITTTSLKEYAHLVEWALRGNSPLPLFWPTVEEWAGALDATRGAKLARPMGQLAKFCQPGDTARSGFMRRLRETHGVVGTSETSLATSLVIQARRPVPKVPDLAGKLLELIRDKWERPDGEKMVDLVSKHSTARQMACGFFYRFEYPRGEPKELRDRWFKARSDWHVEVRNKLSRSKPHLDSPLLVTKAAIRWYEGFNYRTTAGETVHVPPKTKSGDCPPNFPTWAAEFWPAWRDIREQVQYVSVPVWVDDFLARDAAEWAKKHTGIVWYSHDAFGKRVAQLSGCPLYGPGKEASATILNEKGDRSIVASIQAHGTGKNLQMFDKMLVANPPSNGGTWEQLLARLHRMGQKADEVLVEVYTHTPEYIDAFEGAKQDARYIQGTLGTRQKLLYATCDLE